MTSGAQRSGRENQDSPWELRFEGFDPDEEARRESLFGVGNGHLFVRCCAPEAADAQPDDGIHYAGLYRAGGYNRPWREVRGEATRVAALVNLPHPFSLSFRAQSGAWLGSDGVRCTDCVQRLDMRSGLSERAFVVHDAQGRATELRETRLASMADAGLALLRWELTPLNWSGELQVRSRLSLRVANARSARTRAYEGQHLEVEPLPFDDGPGVLAQTSDGMHTFHLGARLSCSTGGLDAKIDAGRGADALWQTALLQARAGVPCVLVRSARLREHAAPGAGAVAPAVQHATAAQAIDAHRAAWARLWTQVQLSVPGHPQIEQACRFGAFHLLQTSSPLSADADTGLPARGWQEGYFAHVFWDELAASGFYATRLPQVARALLGYRHRRLPAARQSASAAGLRGAMFPWRSAGSGAEETPPWQWIPPAQRWKRDHTRLQRHVGSAIAYAAWQYCSMTGDEDELAGDCGELIVEVARLWSSMLRPGASGRLEIHGVVGPDEYHDAYPGQDDAGQGHAGLANNAYTNVMAAWTLRCAAGLCERLSGAQWERLCSRLAIGNDEAAQWDRCSRMVKLPLLANGVIAQFDGYDTLEPADSGALASRPAQPRADWWLLARGDSVTRYQLSKQADVLVLCHLLGPDGLQDMVSHLGYRLRPDWYARTVACYLARISHESSLSRPVCAGALAAIDGTASWKYFMQAMQSDFGSHASASTHEGVHLGAMASGWDVLQRWYLGLWPHPCGLRLAPRPPPQLDDLRTAVCWRGQWLDVALSGRTLCLSARQAGGQDLRVEHEGEWRRLAPGDRLVVRCR